MQLCDYGCGQEAQYQLKNGKWCCSERVSQCLVIRNKIAESLKGISTGPLSEEHKRKISKSHMGVSSGPLSEETKRKMSEAKKGIKTGPHSEKTKRKISKSHQFNLKDYKEKYPFLFVVEELREVENGEIQVHCKNHECENSKEKDGWFTPTKIQLSERIRALEKPCGMIENNFYCSQECKDTCFLYNTRSDPYKNINQLPYTQQEIQILNNNVLDRENGLCEYCGEPAEHVHHIRPKKLEPFFSLDPDYCVAVCKKCHYEYGHKDECSTGNLAKIVCSVESQKFLNQKLENIK